MGRRAEYPDWVKRHLAKGIYVNKVGDKYYLYRGHSESRPGSPHPVKVVDEYLGRVTEAEGLIPRKEKTWEIVVYDFAIPYAVDAACCKNILKGLKTTYRKNGTLVYVCSILTYLYGFADQALYEASWLSLKYPGLAIPVSPSDAAVAGIVRGTDMIRDTAQKAYGECWPRMQAYFAAIVLIEIDGELLLPTVPQPGSALASQFGLHFEEATKKPGRDSIPT